MNYRFPKQGQLFKFAFDAAGILPTKRSEQDGLTEVDKKRIAKQLERLVNEEGNLLARSQQLVQEIAFIITGTINNAKANLLIGDVAMDLLDVYNGLIKEEGTYLNEDESIRWFCRCHAIPSLVLSIQKHMTSYNIASTGWSVPDTEDWFLPTIGEGKITWPLEKAMRWVYQVCGTTQTHFHCPDKLNQGDNPEQQQNLENASNWLNGQGTPSWSSIHWNFSRSLERHSTTQASEKGFGISEAQRESIIQVLFLARLSTYVAKAIANAYGQSFLDQLVTQFRRNQKWLRPEIEALKTSLENRLNQMKLSAQDQDYFWQSESNLYWQWFAERNAECCALLQRIFLENGAPSESEISNLIATYGEYNVCATLEQVDASTEFIMPDGFPQAILDGFQLKSNPRLSESDIDQYLARLDNNNLAPLLLWMEPWLRAVVFYRREKFESAFQQVELAFENAKYSAGRNQYLLVNLYVELAAKNSKWKNFKKGIEWARYLGISIRWLRDQEPTDANLKGVFDLMKITKYSQF